MRSIELFAGAAGLGLGLAKAGFHHEIVVERDAHACRTIRHNQDAGHPLVQGWKVVEADVESVDLSAVAPEPDLLAGGPPCQEFSLGGRHAGAHGERNLWPWTIQAVKTLRPRAFAFENVPGLMAKHSDYLAYLVDALTLPELSTPEVEDWRDDASFLRRCADEGVRSTPTYRVQVNKLLASDFGTAQNRSRLFVVGIRDDVARTWSAPDATHSAEQLMIDKWITGTYWDRHGLSRPEIDEAGTRFMRAHNRRAGDLFAAPLAAHRTVRDAIGDLPEPAPQGTPGILDHEAAPREARAYKGHTGSRIDDPSKTLRAGVHGVSGGENMLCDDYGDRASAPRYRHFTVREAARVQGFPDDYGWPKELDARTGMPLAANWSSALKTLGNAVPVELGEAVGRSLARVLS